MFQNPRSVQQSRSMYSPISKPLSPMNLYVKEADIAQNPMIVLKFPMVCGIGLVVGLEEKQLWTT